MSSTESRIKIFENTKWLCETNERLIESISVSIASQKIILEKDNLPEIKRNRFSGEAQVSVTKRRSFEAASAYSGKVCVLNFASSVNPGGGVEYGASAQEECLCRCSTLHSCLTDVAAWLNFYIPHRKACNRLYNDDIIYTPNITVFKSDTLLPELIDEADWYQVNVITCAAPNLSRPGFSGNSFNEKREILISDEDLLVLHEKRWRRILDVASMEKNDVVIVGAFGCGAFENNPEVVARAAKKVISEYKHAFRAIEFAVYCSKRKENYEIFEKIIKEDE